MGLGDTSLGFLFFGLGGNQKQSKCRGIRGFLGDIVSLTLCISVCVSECECLCPCLGLGLCLCAYVRACMRGCTQISFDTLQAAA